MRTSELTLLACIVLTSACNDLELDPVPLSIGDKDTFATAVQPYIGAGCASLACHGDLGRGFRVQAELGLRADVSLRGTPITDEEITHNLQSIAALTQKGAPSSEHLILGKGLARSAGGFRHQGGDIWQTKQDPGYLCIAAWLDNRLDELAPCELAYEDVKPADP